MAEPQIPQPFVMRVRPGQKLRNKIYAEKREQHRLAMMAAETVYESLRAMDYRFEEGTSPVLALKKCHTMNRKAMVREKKRKEAKLDDENTNKNVVVFEDLGADYLRRFVFVESSATSAPW
ncbi:hypothetical protein Tco_1300595 [Tanacetum coccineum]